MKTKKLNKINSLIQRELSLSINKVLLEDFGMISVNYVLVNKNLSSAKVYVSSLTNKDLLIKSIYKKLFGINNEIIKTVKLRRTPKFEFILDEKQEDINRVEKIIDNFEGKKN